MTLCLIFPNYAPLDPYSSFVRCGESVLLKTWVV